MNENSRNGNMYGCYYWNNSRIDMVNLRMDMVMEHSGMDESRVDFKERSVNRE